jgi:D-3-phosphoglycerate dehydrogenase
MIGESARLAVIVPGNDNRHGLVTDAGAAPERCSPSDGHPMKVAVTDYTFDSLDTELAILAPLGCRIDGRRCKTEQELIDLVSDADCVLTQFAPLTAAVIGAMRKARVVVRYGIGVDNVDLEAARARGIPVCNIPDYCIDEVADHTLAFILALTRQVVANYQAVRAGQWRLAVPLHAIHALKQLTVGVVGFGRIGKEVVARLRPFKCKVLVFDPAVSAEAVTGAGATPAGLEELLTSAGLITLHCPSTPQTRRMINRDSLATMKRGALLVNVGRGDLVDTAALVAALRDGRLGGAALDVCDPEPIPADSPLLKMDNVILSAHVASASVPAVTALRTRAAQTVAAAVRGEPLPNVVNGVRA